MVILLCVLLFLLPMAVGLGILTVCYGKRKKCEITLSQAFPMGMIFCIGLMEPIHAAGLLAKIPISCISRIYAGLLLVAGLVSSVYLLVQRRKEKKQLVSFAIWKRNSLILPVAFLAVFLLQIVLIFTMDNMIVPGDITLETVQSFLAQDGIYRVMPLTGMPNEQGIPLRYEILCLPTLYTVLCSLFQTDPELLVTRLIPVLVLGASYFAYDCLGETLFGKENPKKRIAFLLIVAGIFLVTDSAVCLDGYGALHGGSLGTSIRNLVLVPYVLCAALEKRWWKTGLCILAEACIVWTFWGFGVCLILTAGIAILAALEKKCPRLCRAMQFFHKQEEMS